MLVQRTQATNCYWFSPSESTCHILVFIWLIIYPAITICQTHPTEVPVVSAFGSSGKSFSFKSLSLQDNEKFYLPLTSSRSNGSTACCSPCSLNDIRSFFSVKLVLFDMWDSKVLTWLVVRLTLSAYLQLKSTSSSLVTAAARIFVFTSFILRFPAKFRLFYNHPFLQPSISHLTLSIPATLSSLRSAEARIFGLILGSSILWPLLYRRFNLRSDDSVIAVNNALSWIGDSSVSLKSMASNFHTALARSLVGTSVNLQLVCSRISKLFNFKSEELDMVAKTVLSWFIVGSQLVNTTTSKLHKSSRIHTL